MAWTPVTMTSSKPTPAKIKINGNTNVIEGNYEGDLILKPNGEIYYRKRGQWGPLCRMALLGRAVKLAARHSDIRFLKKINLFGE